MNDIPMNAKKMNSALQALDGIITRSVRLIIGGGGAMVLAYHHPLATHDIDAFPAKGGMSLAELDVAAKQVAKMEQIASDWLNSHFVTFTHVLPPDYASRLRRVFEGERLVVDALGPEDLLIMKCFSGRDKDRPHAVRLMGLLSSRELVSGHLDVLMEKNVPGAERAADYFDDLCDELEP